MWLEKNDGMGLWVGNGQGRGRGRKEEGRGYLGCLRLDLPGTSERTVDFSHDGGCVVLETCRKWRAGLASWIARLLGMLEIVMMKSMRLGRRERGLTGGVCDGDAGLEVR